MTGWSTESVAHVAAALGWMYLTAAAANAVAAWRARRSTPRLLRPLAWLALAAIFALFAARSFAGNPPAWGETIKAAIDRGVGPTSLWLGSLAVFTLLYVGRRWFVAPAAAWAAVNLANLLLGVSLPDRRFADLVLAPDSVPIAGMACLLTFFLWLAARQAVENDRRLDLGLPPREQEYADKALVWPDLVYIELIAMVLLATLLIVWSLLAAAPLEQPANPGMTPNPAKAPWYFVGLQELLVFSDAWLVGVVAPCAALLGLMAIPYLDCNSQGSGHYTLRRRRFAATVFLFGFLMLGMLPILIGTYCRGPNWSAFGPFEPRNPARLPSLHIATLSKWFWTDLFGRPMPGSIFLREIAGIAAVGAYFLALPALLAATLLGGLRRRMGRVRFAIMIFLLLLMLLLPLKMLLRWSVGLSYLVSIPEWSLNI